MPSQAAGAGTAWLARLSAAAEVPKQAVKRSSAHGTFEATLSGKKLTWKLTYAGLTGGATAAHIHMGANGKAGNVVVALCGGFPRCRSGLTGSAVLSTSLISAFKRHLLYVNVHTTKNPLGEIRGQLQTQ